MNHWWHHKGHLPEILLCFYAHPRPQIVDKVNCCAPLESVHVSVTHGQCDASRRDLQLPSEHRALLPFGWYQIILLGDRGTCV